MSLFLVILHDADPPTAEGRARLKTELRDKLKLDEPRIEKIFKHLPVILREHLTQVDAERYLRVLESIGATAEILPESSSASELSAVSAGGMQEVNLSPSASTPDYSVSDLEALLDDALHGDLDDEEESSNELNLSEAFDFSADHHSEDLPAIDAKPTKPSPVDTQSMYSLSFEDDNSEEPESSVQAQGKAARAESNAKFLDESSQISFSDDDSEFLLEAESTPQPKVSEGAGGPAIASSEKANATFETIFESDADDEEVRVESKPKAHTKRDSADHDVDVSDAAITPAPEQLSEEQAQHILNKAFSRQAPTENAEASAGEDNAAALESESDTQGKAQVAQKKRIILYGSAALLIVLVGLVFAIQSLGLKYNDQQMHFMVTDEMVQGMLNQQKEILGNPQKAQREPVVEYWTSQHTELDLETRLEVVTFDGEPVRAKIEMRNLNPYRTKKEEFVTKKFVPDLSRFFALLVKNPEPPPSMNEAAVAENTSTESTQTKSAPMEAKASTPSHVLSPAPAHRIQGLGRTFYTQGTKRSRMASQATLTLNPPFEPGKRLAALQITHQATELPPAGQFKMEVGENDQLRVSFEQTFELVRIPTPELPKAKPSKANDARTGERDKKKSK